LKHPTNGVIFEDDSSGIWLPYRKLPCAPSYALAWSTAFEESTCPPRRQLQTNYTPQSINEEGSECNGLNGPRNQP